MGVDTPEDLENKNLARSEVVLTSIHFLENYLDAHSILAFSETCFTALRMSYKIILKELLSAVVCGNEYLVRKIVASRPELLLNPSAIVKDLSGKEIKNLTPLQAAICACDVDMVKAIKEILHQKLQSGVTLSFNPEFEMQSQFKIIYPNGVDSVETAQKVKAKEFKTSTLETIFDAINTATVVQVKFELETPGETNSDSKLNTALHNFREQFTTTSNLEQISNLFYLQNAFEFYDEKFDNFIGNEKAKWYKRDLFWRQIIGYIQRHLPACIWQAYASRQCIFNIVDDGVKLKRNFQFLFMCSSPPLDKLGYNFAVGWGREEEGRMPRLTLEGLLFEDLLRIKKSGLENLFTRRVSGNYSYLPNRCVIS